MCIFYTYVIYFKKQTEKYSYADNNLDSYQMYKLL